jgi:16S rRNA (cytosine967-C5)-methyltransferase
MKKNARQLCYDGLIHVFSKGGYSNLVLDQILSQNTDPRENSLITALFYGVIERDLTLQYLVSCYSKRAVSKLDLEILTILKMGFYQLLYLERVPDNAAVYETVALCSYAKKTSAKGMVNAMLRAFIRDGKKITISGKDPVKQLSILYSCPVWLCQKWEKEYSLEIARELAVHSIGRPPLCIRVNTLKTTQQKLVSELEKDGIAVKPHPQLDGCLMLEHTGSLERISAFRDGLFYVQDSSSQCCALALEAKPEMTVMDLCSAPGSKAFTIAQQMENRGKLYAFDLYPHKIDLIRQSAQRLGLQNIMAEISDASVFREDLPKADRVLCDVPCSGLGIIRRKPEIKYKQPKELEQLPEIQYRILQNASRYVKVGGKLMYSTCTLNRQENEDICSRFLKEHDEYSPSILPSWVSKVAVVRENQATVFPHLSDGDGFFFALFEKNR